VYWLSVLWECWFTKATSVWCHDKEGNLITNSWNVIVRSIKNLKKNPPILALKKSGCYMPLYIPKEFQQAFNFLEIGLIISGHLPNLKFKHWFISWVTCPFKFLKNFSKRSCFPKIDLIISGDLPILKSKH